MFHVPFLVLLPMYCASMARNGDARNVHSNLALVSEEPFALTLTPVFWSRVRRSAAMAAVLAPSPHLLRSSLGGGERQ